MSDDGLALLDLRMDDERTRAVIASEVGRMVPGLVAAVDDATRTASVFLEGSASASPGIEYGDHGPIAGDVVLVWRGPLVGRRFITHIVGRDAGYLASGTLITPLVAAGVVGASAVASVVVESRIDYRPALLVSRDDGTASHLMTPLVNPAGQITAVFDAYTTVEEGNRTRVSIKATALTTTGVPSTSWKWFLLRERADV